MNGIQILLMSNGASCKKVTFEIRGWNFADLLRFARRWLLSNRMSFFLKLTKLNRLLSYGKGENALAPFLREPGSGEKIHLVLPVVHPCWHPPLFQALAYLSRSVVRFSFSFCVFKVFQYVWDASINRSVAGWLNTLKKYTIMELAWSSRNLQRPARFVKQFVCTIGNPSNGLPHYHDRFENTSAID
jgi:hypothetical protein